MFFFFSSRRRHTRFDCDWSSDVCSSDLSPANAARYRAAGINTFVALWKGPTEEQLKALKSAGMKERKRGGEGKRGDLGGRRIIKKKKKRENMGQRDVRETRTVGKRSERM